MKNPTGLTVCILLLVCALTSCEKKPSSAQAPRTTTKASASPTSAPAGAGMLTAWKQGDKATAISNFVAADWNARPFFAEGSMLNLSEEEFRAQIKGLLSPEAVAMMGTNLMAEVQPLKALGSAVAQEGVNAAAQQDYATARKHFNALKACGEALEGTNSLGLLQLVGKGMKKRAAAELARLPKEP